MKNMLPPIESSAKQPRRIRSFVRRQRAFSTAEAQLYDILWQKYGVTNRGQLQHCFATPAPLIVEIGCGMGDALALNAKSHPQHNYLGIEVHRPGILNLMKLLEQYKQDSEINNVKIIEGDALEILEFFTDATIASIQIFFPDPWPKQRHHKRRLVRKDTVDLFIKKLVPHGELHIATDILHYAQQILGLLNGHPQLQNLSPNLMYSERPHTRPLTRFERKGLHAGRDIYDLRFEMCLF